MCDLSPAVRYSMRVLLSTYAASPAAGVRRQHTLALERRVVPAF